MSLSIIRNLLFLIAIKVLVEGVTTQEENNHTTCNILYDPDCESEKVEEGQDIGPAVDGLVGDQRASSEGADTRNVVTCPDWFIPKRTDNGSTVCECGSNIGGIVRCDNTSQTVKVLEGYCMTYSNDNTSLVVGQCLYAGKLRFLNYSGKRYIANALLCNYFHHDGQLCGKCIDGFAPPVYSYDIGCVNCTDYGSNWAKYIGISFLPLTALFLVVVIFRISATSGLLDVFVLVSQLASAPTQQRMKNVLGINNSLWYNAGMSFHDIWNLDFFRPLYTPFCLHPKMTTLQVLALDYVIAVYPLFLVITTYLLVEMHDHDFRIVVSLWKPFHACFAHFRRKWDIKGSLINVFATFLLLSYVKFLSTSFALLTPIQVYNIHGKALSELYLYYDGTVEFFGKEHLPFAILALVTLLVFNILPLLLLLLYPYRCFHRCLNKYNIRCQVLHVFMDAFQGCYKDGSNGTRDCRLFAALYLMIRIAALIVYVFVSTRFTQFPVTMLVVVFVFLIAIFHPYKSPFHNAATIFLMFVLLSVCISMLAIELAYFEAVRSEHVSHVFLDILLPIPVLYFFVIVFYKLFAHKNFIQKVYRKICVLIRCNCEEANNDFNGSLPWPDRMINAEQYAPLLGPVGESRDDIVEENDRPDY